MKKIILLGLLVFYTALTFAQKNRNRAEVFLQINDSGAYTVYLDNEFVGSENGIFRFYDVYNSNPMIFIYKNNVVLLKRNISVVQDQRLVLKYSKDAGMTVTKQLNLYNNRQYALDDFDNYNDGRNNGIIMLILKRCRPQHFNSLTKWLQMKCLRIKRLLLFCNLQKTPC